MKRPRPAWAMMVVTVASVSCLGAAPARQGDAGNSQHTAAAPAAGQPLTRICWRTPVDLAPQGTGGKLPIQYASPMITAGNVVPCRCRLPPPATGKSGRWRARPAR